MNSKISFNQFCIDMAWVNGFNSTDKEIKDLLYIYNSVIEGDIDTDDSNVFLFDCSLCELLKYYYEAGYNTNGIKSLIMQGQFYIQFSNDTYYILTDY